MEWKSQLKKAVADESLVLGFKSVEKALKEGMGKLVVISKTCPDAELIKHYAGLAGVETVDFSGTGYELGAMAKKPFSVSVLLVTGHDS